MPPEWVGRMLRVHEESRANMDNVALQRRMHYANHPVIHDGRQQMPSSQAVNVILQRHMDIIAVDPCDFYDPTPEEKALLQHEAAKWIGKPMRSTDVYLQTLSWLSAHDFASLRDTGL